MFNTDYEVIGSIGFAQVGTGEYFAKEKVEKAVIKEIIAKEKIFTTPPDLLGIARLVYKRFSHDFGEYYEVCVIYSQELIDTDDTFEEELWDWINDMQSFDFESEEIMERCQELYQKENPMTVIIGGKKKADNNHLKIM